MKKYLAPLLFFSTVALAVTTANMLLDKPVVGQPNYATKIDTIFNQVDAHDHTTGKGVQIPSAGISNGAVTSAKIQANAVTPGKVSSSIIDNSTLEMTSGTIRVKDAGITGAKLNSNVVDNSTLQLTSATVSVKDAGITQAKLQAVTSGVSVTSGNLASANSGSYINGTASYTDITSVTIVSTGRPIFVGMMPASNLSGSLAITGSGNFQARLQLLEDSVGLIESNIGGGTNDAVPGQAVFNCSSFWFVRPVAAGTHVYKVQGRVVTGGGNLSATNCSLIAKEL